MPQTYSTSNNFFKKIENTFFRAHSLDFQSIIRIYNHENKNTTHTQKKSLKVIEAYVDLSPKAYEGIVLCYVHSYCRATQHIDFPEALIPLISSFIKKKEKNEDETYYQLRRMVILGWGFMYGQYGFFADCLADEALYMRLCKLRGIKPIEVLAICTSEEVTKDPIEAKYYMCEFYIHKSNFLRENLLLWLMKECGWPVPSKETIMQFRHTDDREKLKSIQALYKGEQALYKRLVKDIPSTPQKRIISTTIIQILAEQCACTACSSKTSLLPKKGI